MAEVDLKEKAANRTGKKDKKRTQKQSLKELLKDISRIKRNDPDVTEIAASDLGVTASIAEKLANALTSNNKVRRVDLSKNSIGDSGATCFGAMLKRNTTLKELDLRENGLSRNGIGALIDGLRVNVFLERLLIYEKPITLNLVDHTLDPVGDKRREEIELLLDSTVSFQKVLRGESKILKLVHRGMTIVNPNVFSFVSIVKLDLSNNLLAQFPSGIEKLTALQELNLRSNLLKDLTGAEFLPTSLRVLSLDQNKLEVLTGISKLKNLHVLSLAKNNLTDLAHAAAEISELQELRILSLKHNHLKVLPACFGQLSKNLQTLDLRHNGLETLPIELGRLAALHTLRISHNLLKCVPEALFLLNGLQTLDLKHNRLDTLPPALGSLPYLRQLEIAGNPINNVGQSMLTSGTASILSFLRSMKQGATAVYRTKLVILGQPGVGKTSLLESLQTLGRRKKRGRTAVSSNVVDSGDTRTAASDTRSEGITITTWKMPLPSNLESSNPASSSRVTTLSNSGENGHEGALGSTQGASGSGTGDVDTGDTGELTFSAWDFAGQEVFASFFMSPRSIYLLVVSLSQDLTNARIEYWLKVIHAHAKDAPVFIVGTHADDKHIGQEEITNYFRRVDTMFRTRFGNIQAYYAVSTKTGMNIQLLANELVEVALKQPYMPEMLPLSYETLETQLRAKRRLHPTMSWDEYEEMAASCGIEAKDVGVATKFLHDLGELMYFGEWSGVDTASPLRHTVVVDTRWVTTAFSYLVGTRGRITDGCVRAVDLPTVWQPQDGYPLEQHAFLLALLEKFEVIYYVKSEQTVMIPELLPERLPAAAADGRRASREGLNELWYRWRSTDDEYGRIYEFEFLPHGFFSRLIVRFLASEWRALLYWKYGIVLSKANDSVRAFLELDPQRYSLKLAMRGTDAAVHVPLLIESIDTLVKDWLQVQVSISVPCPACAREGLGERGYRFPLKHCVTAVAEGHLIVQCRAGSAGHQEMVVNRLVPDVALSEFGGAKIRFNEIKIQRQIGEGGFAKVYLGEWRGEKVAVKELILKEVEPLGFDYEGSSMTSDPLEVFNEFRREVWLMSGLRHKNIVQLKGLCMKPFCMVLEYMTLGSLYDCIHARGDQRIELDLALNLSIALDIAEGMAFMHSLTPPMVHRDLKSPNILLTYDRDNARNRQGIIAKVADFGLSRSTLLAPSLVGKAVDNPIWLAPEVLMKKNYTEKVDVYAFGVILWELYTCQDFFGEMAFFSAIEDAVLNGRRPPIPPETPPLYAQCIRESWDGDPNKRPAFVELRDRLRGMLEQEHLSNPPNSSGDGAAAFTTWTRPTRKTTIRSEQDAAIGRERMKGKTRNGSINLESMKLMYKLDDEKPVRCMCAVSGGKQVWTGCEDGSVVVRATEDGHVLACRTLHGTRVTQLMLVGDKKVWSASADGIIRLWEVKHDNMVRELRGHTDSVTCLLEVGDHMWSGGQDMTVRQWTAKKNVKTAKVSSPVRCMLNCGNEVWVGTDAGIFRYSAKHVKPVDEQPLAGSNGCTTCMIRVGKDVWCATEGKIVVLNAATGEVQANIALPGNDRAVTLCSDQDFVWAGGAKIHCWDAKSRTYVRALVGPSVVECMLLLFYNKTLWVGGDKSIYVFGSNQATA